MGETENSIPNFIAAADLKELRRLMLLNNIRNGMFYKYFDIQFVKGKWYAFFFQKIDETDTSILGG